MTYDRSLLSRASQRLEYGSVGYDSLRGDGHGELCLPHSLDCRLVFFTERLSELCLLGHLLGHTGLTDLAGVFS